MAKRKRKRQLSGETLKRIHHTLCEALKIATQAVEKEHIRLRIENTLREQSDKGDKESEDNND